MKPQLRSILLFAAGVFIVLILSFTQRDRAERTEETQAEIAATLRDAEPPPARIAYSANHSPLLAPPESGPEIIRSVLNIATPMRFGAYVWNDDGVPEGEVWVRVDLDRQLLSVFRDGHEIGSAVILYGTDGKPTPVGRFTVLQKAKDYHSRTYDAPMPYMLRLTDDGVAIHGSNVRDGWATHGCIGVPTAFAQLLFEQMRMGGTVVILPAGTTVKKAA